MNCRCTRVKELWLVTTTSLEASTWPASHQLQKEFLPLRFCLHWSRQFCSWACISVARFSTGDLRDWCQRRLERVSLRQKHRQPEQDHHHQRQGQALERGHREDGELVSLLRVSPELFLPRWMMQKSSKPMTTPSVRRWLQETNWKRKSPWCSKASKASYPPLPGTASIWSRQSRAAVWDRRWRPATSKRLRTLATKHLGKAINNTIQCKLLRC